MSKIASIRCVNKLQASFQVNDLFEVMDLAFSKYRNLAIIQYVINTVDHVRGL